MESPPKRMTRARAAAKATEPAVKTTKIVTAAAKAKAAPSTATAGTKSTAAKRKTRADEGEDESEHEEATARRARGRPRKNAANEDELAAPAPAPAPARATRTRTTKKTASDAVTDEAAPKPTRGRPRKVVEPEAEESGAEAPKKTTRARAGTTSKATGATASSKAATKKSVKFQEPDKENVEPAAKTREPAATSIRGRPARRGGAAGARGGRAGTKASEAGQKKPLSPKKVTQMPFSRDHDSSEDELAMEKPVKAMMKSPIKPPASPKKQLEVETDSTIEVNAAVLNAPELGTSVLMSPRRLPASALKESMKSPARRIGPIQLPGSTMKPSNAPGQTSPFKTSLLQSAAKRPQSPIKGLNFGSTQKSQNSQSAMKSSMLQSPAKRAFPGFKSLNESRQQELGQSPAMKPFVVATSTPGTGACPSQKLMMEEAEHSPEGVDDDVFSDPIGNIKFSGRLSAVFPRDADPALDDEMSAVHEEEEELELVEPMTENELVEEIEQLEEAASTEFSTTEPAEPILEIDDPMAIDEAPVDMEESAEEPASTSATPPHSPVEEHNPMYQLREKDLEPDMYSDSEDELASPSKRMPPSPSPAGYGKSRETSHSPRKNSRRSTMGLTSLADKLDSWSTGGSPEDGAPEESEPVAAAEQSQTAGTPAADPTMQNSFFEDEMVVRPETVLEDARAVADQVAQEEAEEVAFADVMITNEDVALAQEANEMSLMEPEQVEEAVEAVPSQSFDDSLSEASQEYGDENQVPIDPALLGSNSLGLVTPVRPVHKSFNTTTKIPLKPADNSTPSPLKKRSFSASRVAPRRPGAPTRNATVISYSPTKERRRSSMAVREPAAASAPSTPGPVTPGKTDIWSTMGTPARTPRKDINPALLRGAIVHVDVHTSEGADASGIFVELLSQMGARCVKSWTWNPNGSQNGESSSTKVGITHVVYKDGGKRTMEKVREANGVVQCVGVSWVLDCERENEWLDEAPYYIDTSLVPRGGARRRKSMEPKALANLNGTLVSSPAKGSSGSTSPNTPMNRRQSTVWMHSPSDQGDEDAEGDDVEWSKFILTPVPKTPAPEAVARYAAEVPETPSTGSEYDMTAEQALLMQTCPPKTVVYQDMGEGILGRDKDEQVLMRLMAVRRKSLQFAPKIGSPLANAWK